MNTPPCKDWSIWIGVEIEGHASNGRGTKTLFIRSLASYPHLKPTDDFGFLREKTKCERIWFCKEFTNWALIKAIQPHFKEVCIEVEPKCFENIPKHLRDSCRIFLKVAIPLKDGDVVCVGPTFSDEAFEKGTGHKVKPEQYLNDRKIV